MKKSGFFLCAVALALYAASIAVPPWARAITVSGTYTNNSRWNISSDDPLTITGSGTVNNETSGILDNLAGAVMRNDGRVHNYNVVYNRGTLNNYGLFTNRITVYNYGTFYNYGIPEK